MILPTPMPNMQSVTVTIPYMPAMSDVIAQTAVATIVPPARDRGRYSVIRSSDSKGRY